MIPFFGSLSFLPLVAVLDLSEEDGDFDCCSIINLMRIIASITVSLSCAWHSSRLWSPPHTRQYRAFDASATTFSNWSRRASNFCSAFLRLGRLTPHVFYIIINFDVINPGVSFTWSLLHPSTTRRRRRRVIFRFFNFSFFFIFTRWDLDHLRVVIVVRCWSDRHSCDLLLHDQIENLCFPQDCNHHLVLDWRNVCLPRSIAFRVDGVSVATRAAE